MPVSAEEVVGDRHVEGQHHDEDDEVRADVHVVVAKGAELRRAQLLHDAERLGDHPLLPLAALHERVLFEVDAQDGGEAVVGGVDVDHPLIVVGYVRLRNEEAGEEREDARHQQRADFEREGVGVVAHHLASDDTGAKPSPPVVFVINIRW
eukprot:5560510-Pyramimonas_sp.AAC.1